MNFYCCQKLIDSNCVGRPFNDESISDVFMICDEFACEKIDYCPFCGHKLSSL